MKSSPMSAVCCLLLLSIFIFVTYTRGESPDDFPSAPASLVSLISNFSLAEHLRFLGNSSLGGRAPGTPGEKSASEYIAKKLAAVGIQPAGDSGTFFQAVPLVGKTPKRVSDLIFYIDNASPSLCRPVIDDQNILKQLESRKKKLNRRSSDGYPLSLTLPYLVDYVATTGTTQKQVTITADNFIFAGYGIVAPEKGWNDYKYLNATGKVLLILAGQPKLFGEELTYYGRWTYKYEEAQRQKALGVFLIHTTPKAGYPFSVVLSSNEGEQIFSQDAIINPLQLQGWIDNQSADHLADMLGLSLNDLFDMSENKDFVSLFISFSLQVKMEFTFRQFGGTNVVGVLKGSSPHQSGQAVVLSGHLDHLGTRNGTVYPGALDNASGASLVLALAECFAKAKLSLNRTLLFLFPTAEESGLLGSAYYANHPFIPIQDTISVINFDIANLWGATRDISVLGQSYSELGNVFEVYGKQKNISLSPDPFPSAGFFFRSDHLSFAKLAVPGVWVFCGKDFIGQPPDFFQKVIVEGYYNKCYHQPCDSLDAKFLYEGAIQQAQISAAVAYGLLITSYTPACLNHGRCM